MKAISMGTGKKVTSGIFIVHVDFASSTHDLFCCKTSVSELSIFGARACWVASAKRFCAILKLRVAKTLASVGHLISA